MREWNAVAMVAVRGRTVRRELGPVAGGVTSVVGEVCGGRSEAGLGGDGLHGAAGVVGRSFAMDDRSSSAEVPFFAAAAVAAVGNCVLV